MRWYIRTWLLVVAGVAGTTLPAWGQSPSERGDHPVSFGALLRQPPYIARGQQTFVGEITLADPEVPIPTKTTRYEQGGFFTAYEFVFLKQVPRALGNQIIAFEGFYDATGAAIGAPGNPGTFIGTANVALDTANRGNESFQPGFNVIAGYRFANGITLSASYLHLFDAQYATSATSARPLLQQGFNLTSSFISAPVFNFPTPFNGPTGFNAASTDPGQQNDVAFDAIVPGTGLGIWNAAEQMSWKFTQRYSQVEVVARVPLLESDFARTYGIAGGRYSWFHDSFTWITIDENINGFARPQDVAEYSNILSQRMYGPMVGCGHELYLGNRFAVSLDLTGSLLLSVVKQRAKYERGDRFNQSKRSALDYEIVPNLNGHINLWWYPVKGVQMRVGYQAMNFFNTYQMDQPVGFDYGAIDPDYDDGFYRLLHGFNVGIGFIW